MHLWLGVWPDIFIGLIWDYYVWTHRLEETHPPRIILSLSHPLVVSVVVTNVIRGKHMKCEKKTLGQISVCLVKPVTLPERTAALDAEGDSGKVSSCRLFWPQPYITRHSWFQPKTRQIQWRHGSPSYCVAVRSNSSAVSKISSEDLPPTQNWAFIGFLHLDLNKRMGCRENGWTENETTH